MRSQLNVTLLKAILQVHNLVTLTEEQLSCQNADSQIMDAALTEVESKKEFKWKQNQVPNSIDTFSKIFQSTGTRYMGMNINTLWTMNSCSDS